MRIVKIMIVIKFRVLTIKRNHTTQWTPQTNEHIRPVGAYSPSYKEKQTNQQNSAFILSVNPLLENLFFQILKNDSKWHWTWRSSCCFENWIFSSFRNSQKSLSQRMKGGFVLNSQVIDIKHYYILWLMTVRRWWGDTKQHN